MPVALRAVRRWVGPYVLLLLLWYLLALSAIHWRNIDFPTPWATAATFVQLLFGQSALSHEFYRHIGISLARWVDGFVVAGVVGVGTGLLLGVPELMRRGNGTVSVGLEPHSSTTGLLKRLAMPAMRALQAIPSLAWIPVALLLFGRQAAAIPFLIALACVFVIIAATVAGVQSVDVLHVRAARMLGAKRGRLWLKVVLPGAAPNVWGGLRAGFVFSWWTLIAAEMVLARRMGLGFVLYDARGGTDYAYACAVMIVVAIIGSFMSFLLHSIERHSLRGRDPGEEAV